MKLSLRNKILSMSCTALTAVGLGSAISSGGCGGYDREPDRVVVRQRERYYQPPPPREVVVERPVERVVYEPAPREVLVEQPVERVVYVPAPQEVVVVYEQELTPHGHWVQTQSYGRCWVYDRRPAGWRPYTVGHWVYTDEGMAWVSEGDEAAWGATCYHYGRWYEDSYHGWVWVPGRVWGPSWVAWREGNGYCGWAPLPPECGDGYPVNVVVVDRYVPPEGYIFCDERHACEPRIQEHIVQNNVTIINQTTNITNITYVDNRAVNRGVSAEHVEQRSGKRVETVHMAQARDKEEAHRLVQSGQPVLYSPPALENYVAAHPLKTKKAEHPEQPIDAQHPKPNPQYKPVQPQRPRHDAEAKPLAPEQHGPGLHPGAQPKIERRTPEERPSEAPTHIERMPASHEQPNVTDNQPVSPEPRPHVKPPRKVEEHHQAAPNPNGEPKARVKEESKTEERHEAQPHQDAEPKSRVKEDPKAEERHEAKPHQNAEPKARVKEDPKADERHEAKPQRGQPKSHENDGTESAVNPGNRNKPKPKQADKPSETQPRQ